MTTPDHRHLAAVDALKLPSATSPEILAVVKAIEDADRERGVVRIDTRSPQIKDALAIAFYEGYHGKPLADKDWAGTLAIHHKYVRAAYEVVSALRKFEPRNELAAVDCVATAGEELPANGAEVIAFPSRPGAQRINRQSVMDTLDAMLLEGAGSAARPHHPAGTFNDVEWGTHDTRNPIADADRFGSEEAARAAVDASDGWLLLLRRGNTYEGCILTTGTWERPV